MANGTMDSWYYGTEVSVSAAFSKAHRQYASRTPDEDTERRYATKLGV